MFVLSTELMDVHCDGPAPAQALDKVSITNIEPSNPCLSKTTKSLGRRISVLLQSYCSGIRRQHGPRQTFKTSPTRNVSAVQEVTFLFRKPPDPGAKSEFSTVGIVCLAHNTTFILQAELSTRVITALFGITAGWRSIRQGNGEGIMGTANKSFG